MFKRLKIEFIRANMVMISLIMVCSFVFVYVMTYNNIQNQSQLKLENVEHATMRSLEMSKTNDDLIQQVLKVQFPAGGFIKDFGLVIDDQWNIVLDTTWGLLPNDFLFEAVSQVKRQEHSTGRVDVYGETYLYKRTEAVAKIVNDVETNNEIRIEKQYTLSFINVAESIQTLKQLLKTFVYISVVALSSILLISVFLARKSVAPIEKSYLKQKQFIQDASHELKTPLASITSNLYAIQSNPKQTVEMQEKWLGFIEYELNRMTKLVSDLLYLARSEDGDIQRFQEVVNLSEVLEYAIVSIEALAFEKDLHLKWGIKTGVTISGEVEKVEQLVSILLDNAIKYTEPQGAIDVHLSIVNHRVVLSVENTGDGIGESHIDHVFDRFYKVDPSRNSRGSYGLGLAIAKSIVEELNAHISVKSKQGEKTIFTVEFKRYF